MDSYIVGQRVGLISRKNPKAGIVHRGTVIAIDSGRFYWIRPDPSGDMCQTPMPITFEEHELGDT